MGLVSCCVLFVLLFFMCFVGCYFLLKLALRIPLDYVRLYGCFLGVFFKFFGTFCEMCCLWVVILFGLKTFLKTLYSVLGLLWFCVCIGGCLGFGCVE